jgi:hypothetical protein
MTGEQSPARTAGHQPLSLQIRATQQGKGGCHTERMAVDRGRGQLVTLRPLTEADIEPLYVAATAPWNGARSRWHGVTPSPDEFRRTVWQGIRAQYAVASHDGKLLGLVSSYNFNPPAAAYAAFMPATPEAYGPPVAEAFLLFFGLLFNADSLAKIYVEVPGYVERNQSLLTRLLTREAVFRDFVYWDGRLWDVEHWSVSCDEYAEHVEQISARFAMSAGVMTRGAFDDRFGEYLDPFGQQFELKRLDSLAVVELAVLVEVLCGVSADATVKGFCSNRAPDIDDLYSRHVSHTVNTSATLGGTP